MLITCPMCLHQMSRPATQDRDLACIRCGHRIDLTHLREDVVSGLPPETGRSLEAIQEGKPTTAHGSQWDGDSLDVGLGRIARPLRGGGVGIAVVTLLILIILLDLVGIGVNQILHGQLQEWVQGGRRLQPEALERTTTLADALAVLGFPFFVAAGVVFLIWFYRVCDNLTILRAEGEFSPGWAVGYWFIPFLNLVRPFQVTREIWKASDPAYAHDPDGWKAAPSTPLIGLWWFCYLAGNLLAYAGIRTENQPNPEAELILVRLVQISAALSIAAAILLIPIVRSINARQHEKLKRMTHPEEPW